MAVVGVVGGGRCVVQFGVHCGRRGVTCVGFSVDECQAVQGGANSGGRGVAVVGVVGSGRRAV